MYFIGCGGFQMAHKEQRKGVVLAVFDTLTFGVPVLLWNLYKNTNKTLKLMIPIILIVGFITYLSASLY